MPRRRRRLHIVHGGKNRIFPISISSIFSMKILAKQDYRGDAKFGPTTECVRKFILWR